MSEIFWNAEEKNIIKGLDVLGYRRYDQGWEQEWVAGITTISFRARYLTLLPWALQEYFEAQTKSEEHTAIYDEKAFKQFLRRFEMVVFLATHHDETGLGTYGVLGSDLFSEHEEAIMEHGSAEAVAERGGAVLNTYIMPARTLGILAANRQDSVLPVAISSLGQKVHASRAMVTEQSKLLEVILNGGTIYREDIDREAEWYSVNTISSIPEEAELLRTIYTEKQYGVDEGLFDRFQRTLTWCLDSLAELEQCNSTEVLNKNFQKVVLGEGYGASKEEHAWFQYELLRRVHLSLELMLQAVEKSLRDIGRSTVTGILTEWQYQNELAPLVNEQISWDIFPLQSKVSDVYAALDHKTFLVEGVNHREIRNLDAYSIAAFSTGFLLTLLKQSGPVLRDNPLSVKESVVPVLTMLLDNSRERTIAEFLHMVLNEFVIGPHMHNAMRKMAAGGKCTLRFYEDGDELCPTGLDVLSGQSGDRLGNVLGHLADLGYASREENTRFAITDLGIEELAIRRASK